MSGTVSVGRAALGSSLVMLAAWVCGCGGKAHSTEAGPAASAGQGGSAGSGGAAALAGTAGSDVEPLAFDDAVPWFDGSGYSTYMSGSDRVLHIVASGAPARSTLSTHNHAALLSGVSAIELSARASEPLRLMVSASNAIQQYDYFAARDAGMQWPVAPVDVGVDWQAFSVPLADMMPPEAGDSDGIPSFFLAFIVESPVPVEVWLDDVRFVR
jgi:hypothetical protein